MTATDSDGDSDDYKWTRSRHVWDDPLCPECGNRVPVFRKDRNGSIDEKWECIGCDVSFNVDE